MVCKVWNANEAFFEFSMWLMTYENLFKVLKFASLDDEERMDPMVRVFPKVTKCSFQNFGVSGSIQEWVKINHQRSDIFKLVSKLPRFDGLCVLPINMINDKIYILLWFWLFILANISGLHFIYRYKRYKRYLIFPLWNFWDAFLFSFRLGSLSSTRLRTNYLRTVSPSLSMRTFQFLQNNVGFGDWLLLVMMAIHLDIKLFSDILEEIGDMTLPTKYPIMIPNSMSRECREMRGAEPGREPQHGARHRHHRGWKGQAEARPQQKLPDNQCGHADS